MAELLKIDKKYIDEAVQNAIEDFKQNFVPLSVIADIQSEIDDEWYRVKHESIECAEGLEMASEIINKHISGKGEGEE